MLVSAREGRAVIDSAGNRVHIKIPTAKNIFIMLFLCVWLGGWFFGEASAINSVLSGKMQGNDGFILFWLCGWTIGGGWAVFTLFWNLAGAETITAGQGFLTIKKSIFGFGLSRDYTLSAVKNFRFEPEYVLLLFLVAKVE